MFNTDNRSFVKRGSTGRFFSSLVLLLILVLGGCDLDNDTSSNPASDQQTSTSATGDNQPPNAKITAPQTSISGQTVTLNGSGSSDADGDTLSYQWTQTKGPNIPLSNSSSSNLTFVVPEVTQTTQFIFQLTVHDGELYDSASVSMQISPVDDNTSPLIISRSPQPDQSGVSPNAKISVVFDEALLESSIEGHSLLVSQDSSPVSGTVSYDSSNYTLTFKPASDLSAGVTYKVTLANTLTDLAGNTFAGESWSFITGVCGTANDGGNLTLNCPTGQVINEVIFASYGTPKGTCGSFSKGSCDASNSMTVVLDTCKGMDICTLNADKATFGEQCEDSDNHLAVQVSCGMAAPPEDIIKRVDLQAVASSNSVKLTWSLTGITPRTQEIMRNSDPEPSGRSRIGVASGGNEFIDQDVTAGNSYYYWIKATDVDSTVTDSQVASVTVPTPDNTTGVTGLKSLVNFPIGVAVNAGNENNSIISSGTSAKQQAVVFPNFNQMTAGNIMKMSYLHPSENSFTFDQADDFVSFATDNGIAVHAHTLIWHSDYQVPSFMKNYSGDFANMLKNHVQTIVKHYAGKVDSWDVVNEALADNGEGGAVNGFRNSVFYQKLGVDFIDQAFINAREADPDADLYYNDYSIENGDAKTNNMLSLVDGLKARKVPITGVGFQMHVLSDWPNTSTIEAAMKAVADRGLKVKISELDVRVNNPYNSSAPVYTSLTAEAAAKQKERYRQIAAAYLRAVPPALRGGITIWGVWDADSWLNTSDHPDWPLLFDDDFNSKPALQGFADGLTGQ